MEETIRSNMTQMTSKSKFYIPCLLLIIIKRCHMITWDRSQHRYRGRSVSPEKFMTLWLNWERAKQKYTYQKRLTNHIWKRLRCQTLFIPMSQWNRLKKVKVTQKIINLSSKLLVERQINLLRRGLKFTPTHKT